MSSAAGPRPPTRRGASAAIRDRAVTGLLVAALAVAGAVIALPRTSLTPTGDATPQPSSSGSAVPAGAAVYREGVLGRPTSITPVTARSRADRTLVGLIYSGLVKIGPGNTLVPDLASSWTVDKAGQTWTVSIRQDALWQDGMPVTADDVVYTVSALKDPSASGGLSAAWADVTVEALDAKTVRFTLGAPVGGFLAALTQPLLPSHLLTGAPMSDLAAGAFAQSPVGSGPYQLVQIDAARAVLLPSHATEAAQSAGPSALPSGPGSTSPAASAPATAGSTAGSASPAGSATPSAPASQAASAAPSASADPTARPVGRVEVDFYDSEAELAAAYQAGEIDAAAGLSPSTTATLAATSGSSVVDYPTTTLSAILLNLRTSHPELADPRVRKALLEAIDRASIAGTSLGGQARVADALIPPESWAFDATKVTRLRFDRAAAGKLLKAAGWTQAAGAWRAPKAKTQYAIELLTVPPDVNPRLAAIADAVQASWTALGLRVTVTEIAGADLAARLRAGTFTAALLDIASGLEPDLYPLLDSSQVRAAGSNRSGYQDPGLDRLLEAARQPGTTAARRSAWGALLQGLSDRLPVLPIVWADEEMVVRGLSGNVPELIERTGDRYWDVLAWRLAASR